MIKNFFFRSFVFSLFFMVAVTAFAQKGDQKLNETTVAPNLIMKPIAFEITKPLKENPIYSDVLLHEHEFIFNNHNKRKIDPNIFPPDFANMPEDKSEQTKAGWKPVSTKATMQNFAGQNSGSYPPDANGAVNGTYYFQVVNTTYAIYNKNNGSIVAGPSALNSIFNSSLPGAGCNDGDPIILWDEHANKWFYAEFSLCGSNDYMLIAVSQTSDPTGSWYSWSFDVADTPDYMKFGIWQDGYYMATNTSGGNDVYVFDRSAMINGNSNPTMIGFDNPNRPSTFDGFHCILPLDNDGAWAPSGTPGQFVTIVDNDQGNPSDALWIYELVPDWNTPSNSTFTRTQTLNVNAFAGNFTGNWNNIPQSGTAQKLDAISTVLMYRAQYRNFSGDQRLVLAHTIAETSDEAALRWYELVNSGSGWSIRQQSTYNPDNISRWNMSIAMNGNKEIGIGYSVSNSSMNPGIRYIGQSTSSNTAANNTLDMAETVIWNGSYSQSSYNRWGDYCNISVDPSDDHTFWYTNEYMGSGTHGTRIASFELSGATGSAPVADFSADNLTPIVGQTVSFTDASTNIPTTWAWSFSPSTVTFVNSTSASSQNPQVTFNAVGTYSVTLIATNAYGNDTETKTNYITVGTASGCTGGVSSYPYHQGFENTLGAWTQSSNDDFNWTLRSGSTPSSNTGPSGANEGSYYVYMESSSPNYSNKRAILNSPCYDLSSETVATLFFDYHMYGASTMGSLALEASTDNGLTWSSIWSKSGNQGNSWFNAEIDLSAYLGSSVQFRFNGITGTTWQGDMAVDALYLNTEGGSSGGGGCENGITAYPYTQSFENTFGNWAQDTGDDFDWSLRSGSTPSRNTGPSSANDGTYYVYMESSSPNYSNKTAILNSPCFDLSAETEAILTFDYHMYGASTMGDLALEATTDGSNWNVVWNKSGNQGNSWYTAEIDLSNYVGGTVQFRLNGTTGTTWQGDMAVDAFEISNGGSSGGDCINTSLSITFDNYPEETSWDVKDSSNNVVFSGGTYGSQADGSTLVIPMCVDPGCYTFTIYDSYGDGICCGYGNGSYTYTNLSDNSVIASGGSFTSSEATNFCLTNLASHTPLGNNHEPIPDVVLYPIPAKDNLFVSLKDAKMESYSITNMIGQTVKTGKVSDIPINISNLQEGVYLIKFVSDKKQLSRRFVKK